MVFPFNKLVSENLEGITCLYLDKGVILKVRVCRFAETEEKLVLTLKPLDNIFATENEDDKWTYNAASYLKQPFDFGGEKACISLYKGILAVPFCGSLNLNEFAVQHFDHHEPDFHMLWYNIAPDSD
jgi:hypothetical protein